jgi:hypothetical protein
VKLGLLLGALAACSSSKPVDPPPQPLAKHAPVPAPPGVKVISGFDPASGMHVDDDGRRTDVPVPASVQPAHAGHPIDVTLRSSPPGAQVAVDGSNVGATPTFATVMADGSPHEFVFTLAHHSVARYRFVPVTSGVLHARLEQVADEPPTDDDSPPDPVPGVDLVAPPPAPVAKPDATPPAPSGLGPQP